MLRTSLTSQGTFQIHLTPIYFIGTDIKLDQS